MLIERAIYTDQNYHLRIDKEYSFGFFLKESFNSFFVQLVFY